MELHLLLITTTLEQAAGLGVEVVVTIAQIMSARGSIG